MLQLCAMIFQGFMLYKVTTDGLSESTCGEVLLATVVYHAMYGNKSFGRIQTRRNHDHPRISRLSG
jgi:hypothetical protein